MKVMRKKEVYALTIVTLYFLGFLFFVMGGSIYTHNNAVVGLLSVAVGITFWCWILSYYGEEFD